MFLVTKQSNLPTMSTPHRNYPHYTRHRAGSSVRRTLHDNYQRDRETSQPYPDYQALNQMAHGREVHTKYAGHQVHQCFHLQTPSSMSKPRLKQSVSLPVHSPSQSSYPHVDYTNRPLPSIPDESVRMPIYCVRPLLRRTSEDGGVRLRKKTSEETNSSPCSVLE